MACFAFAEDYLLGIAHASMPAGLLPNLLLIVSYHGLLRTYSMIAGRFCDDSQAHEEPRPQGGWFTVLA